MTKTGSKPDSQQELSRDDLIALWLSVGVAIFTSLLALLN